MKLVLVEASRSAGASNCSPASWAAVSTWPLVTGVPSASVIVPTEGRPVTVMVNGLPSTSVGALRPSGVFADSSATVMVELEATGTSLTGVTLMFTVALEIAPLPSVML